MSHSNYHGKTIAKKRFFGKREYAQNLSDARHGRSMFEDVLKGTAENIGGTRNAADEDFERIHFIASENSVKTLSVASARARTNSS